MSQKTAKQSIVAIVPLYNDKQLIAPDTRSSTEREYCIKIEC